MWTHCDCVVVSWSLSLRGSGLLACVLSVSTRRVSVCVAVFSMTDLEKLTAYITAFDEYIPYLALRASL